LKRIVLITGQNGSGKSRLLNRVTGLNGWQTKYNQRQLKIWHVKENRINLGSRMNGTQGGWIGAEFSETNPTVVSFVSKSLMLTDPAQQKEVDQISTAERASSPGAAHLAQSTIPYIQRVQRQWWDAKHQDNRDDDAVKSEIIQNYESLKEIVDVVLGAELDKDYDGRPTLFTGPIAQAKLSDGQKALLQWCVGLHAQRTSLDGIILTMDEPENHLHPEAMIDAVKRIIDSNPNGQIWLATHSVPLIAAIYRLYSEELSVFFMDNGRASYVGEQPEKILVSLMGGQDNVEALRQFVDLPEVFASNRFAGQCLLEPDVIATGEAHDPQIETLRLNLDDRTKLMDFGAGAGRLISCLHAKIGDKVKTSLDYVAWEVCDKRKSECLHAIATAFGEDDQRWFNQRQALFAKHDTNSFDLVVMCNVLHEIPPDSWASVFNSTSIITEALSTEGHLVIIEDYLMPKGEYAHPLGFIVLDSQPLQKLFACTSSDITVVSERNGRIKAHYIPKPLLSNVTEETVKEALLFAQRHAEERVRTIRAEGKSTFKAGRAHGFWVQQYANTSLALA